MARQLDRKSSPHKYLIAKYWMDKEVDFVVDIGEPACFACEWYEERWETFDAASMLGDEECHLRRIWSKTSGLQICHLVPHVLGGSDTELSNLVLLCKECHSLAPDYIDPSFMLTWMRKQEVKGALEDWKKTEKQFYKILEMFNIPWSFLDEEKIETLASSEGFRSFCKERMGIHISHDGSSRMSDRAVTYAVAFCDYIQTEGVGEV